MHMKIIIMWTKPAENDGYGVIACPNTQDVRKHKASIHASWDDSEFRIKTKQDKVRLKKRKEKKTKQNKTKWSEQIPGMKVDSFEISTQADWKCRATHEVQNIN